LHDLAAALAAAWQLVLSGDAALVGIVSLSLSISLTAVLPHPRLGCRSALRSRCCGFQGETPGL
jgi:ABC-type tungstate transport system substrate-binding protein